MSEPKLMAYAEAAAFIGVTVGTLYSMVARRIVPHHRIGRRLVRFSRDELQAWLARNAVPDQREGDKSVGELHTAASTSATETQRVHAPSLPIGSGGRL